MFLKFIYSEKATKFCKVSTVDLSYVVPVISKVELSLDFVAFSEYMNFKKILDKTLLVVLALPRVLQKEYVRYYLLNITKVFAYLSE